MVKESDAKHPLYEDSAFTGALQDITIEKYGMINQFNENGNKSKPLTMTQIANNQKN